ncbi:hypothetical protein [Azospirillum sp. Marseille-Q6669]
MALLSVPIVHIPLSNTNDGTGAIRRHVGKRMEGGTSMQIIVEDAWRSRGMLHSGSTRSDDVNPPDFIPVEIYYDPQGVGNASEEEVLDALRKAGT